MNNFPSHSTYSGVHLFNETTKALPISKDDVTQISTAVKEHENQDFEWVEVAFVDEKMIRPINKEHLGHDYVTDIITFSYGDRDKKSLEGTLYCCAPQIKKQAKENNQSVKKEFFRIVIHGFLHLCGYNDKTESQKKKMKKRENFYLSELSLM